MDSTDEGIASVSTRGYQLGDHKAIRLKALYTRNVQVIVVSKGLPSELLYACGMHPAASVEEALRIALRDKPGSEILLVEDAGNLFLRVKPG